MLSDPSSCPKAGVSRKEFITGAAACSPIGLGGIEVAPTLRLIAHLSDRASMPGDHTTSASIRCLQASRCHMTSRFRQGINPFRCMSHGFVPPQAQNGKFSAILLHGMIRTGAPHVSCSLQLVRVSESTRVCDPPRTTLPQEVGDFGFWVILGHLGQVATSSNVTDEVWKRHIEEQKPPAPDDDFNMV